MRNAGVSKSIVLAILALGVSSAHAQGVYKCVGRDATAYQSMPCDEHQIETRIASEPAANPPPSSKEPAPRANGPAVVANASRADRAATTPKSAVKPGRTWPGRRTIALGMTDDEVLNLPGWGIPSRIARAKGPQGWREEWTYQVSPTQDRQLRFANAKLVEIVDGLGSPQYAELTLQ